MNPLTFFAALCGYTVGNAQRQATSGERPPRWIAVVVIAIAAIWWFAGIAAFYSFVTQP